MQDLLNWLLETEHDDPLLQDVAARVRPEQHRFETTKELRAFLEQEGVGRVGISTVFASYLAHDDPDQMGELPAMVQRLG